MPRRVRFLFFNDPILYILLTFFDWSFQGILIVDYCTARTWTRGWNLVWNRLLFYLIRFSTSMEKLFHVVRPMLIWVCKMLIPVWFPTAPGVATIRYVIWCACLKDVWIQRYPSPADVCWPALCCCVISYKSRLSTQMRYEWRVQQPGQMPLQSRFWSTLLPTFRCRWQRRWWTCFWSQR